MPIILLLPLQNMYMYINIYKDAVKIIIAVKK